MEKSYTRGRPVHPEYHKLGFRRIKVDGKSSVVCEHCKCVLQNTATKRLRGHRNVCQMTPQRDIVKQEEVVERDDSLHEVVSPKEEDPLNSYARTSSSYIELQPPSPGIEYAQYSDDSEDVTKTLPRSAKPTSRGQTLPRKRLRYTAEPDNLTDVVKQMLDTFTAIVQQKSQTPTAEFGDEAFCNWLLTQFASMAPQRKLRVQHEISNMVFRAHAEDTNADM
ncbi:uncharacterized protein LOC132255396 [Phlebotomus argentipes]|uniref:uncharacterized protein LOC132255396 n=1 Tax=Phlebotomus argentipes TaxID=94469 RepID=UPI002892B67D|nr:uncharacterized protein LOC132255396 [Phlebotomus argentipes]